MVSEIVTSSFKTILLFLYSLVKNKKEMIKQNNTYVSVGENNIAYSNR